MNVKSFILSLLETPIGNIKWIDKVFLHEILEGYSSAYAMDKKNKKNMKKKNYQIQIIPKRINQLRIKI
jgi:hypothetical protein